MASPNNANDRIVVKTVWLLFAVAVNALEFFVPRIPFFPWLKPGFANIITIIWIIEFGAVDALLYSLLRIWIVGFFFGFSFLTMALSMSGGVLSTMAMAVLWALLGKRKILGTVGLGICGALFHNLGQIFAVYGLMAANMHLFYQVPVMLVASVIFGGLVGWLAPVFRDILITCDTENDSVMPAGLPSFSASVQDYIFSLLLLAGCFAIVFTESLRVLLPTAAGAAIIVQVERKGSLKAFLKPIFSFWVLFAFIACINLFFSYGTRIERFPLLTHEGVDLTTRQWLRLWTWLQLSFVFSYFNFHAVMLSMLRKLFPNHRATLFAGVLSLEYFPAIAGDSRRYMKKNIAAVIANPGQSMRRLVKGTQGAGFVRQLIEALYGIVAKRMQEK